MPLKVPPSLAMHSESPPSISSSLNMNQYGMFCRRRLHQQGQPLSSSALYTLFLAGLTLLYAVYIRPTLLPSKEVFQAVRAFSNTLFSYSQHLKTAEPLHNIFEELSLHCLERMNSRPEHPQLAAKAQETSAPADWQEALFGTTNEISESKTSLLVASHPKYRIVCRRGYSWRVCQVSSL